MKKEWFSIYQVSIFCLSIILLCNVCEAGYFDSEILRDLKGIKVQLMLSDETVDLLKIDTEKLTKHIEFKLEEAGINLYKTETTEFYKTGRPEIQIKIYPQDYKNENSLDVAIITSFVITVRSFTNPKATNRVPITSWLDFGCERSANDILYVIDKHIEKFSEAMCKPKKGHICGYADR